jgi:long-chain acyl-CoA synthetase
MTPLTEISGPPVDAAVGGRWIFDRIEEWAKREPNRPAFVLDQADYTEEFSYADVIRFMNEIASILEARGIQRGDRVGILMENVPHWVFALLGILRIGAIAVPLAPPLPESTLKRFCRHAECSLVFVDAQNLEMARGLDVPYLQLPYGEGEKAAEWPSPFQAPRDDETALIIYTSGTTGDPKGVEITLSNLAHEIRGVIESFELSDNHHILSVLPFSHVLPLVANGIGPLCIGASVIFLSSISPQRIVDAFHKHRITFFVCVPQFFYVLHKRIFSQVAAQSWILRKVFRLLFSIAGHVRNPEYRRKLFARIHRTVGPELRVLASGGSRFDPQVANDLDRLGYAMLQAYRLTETSAAATATPWKANAIGTVGLPIRGVEVRIDSANGDGVGEICIRGPILMKGYYRDPAATQDAVKDRWFYSGDLGYLQSDGNLVITGRSKDVIVLANGKNVYPEDLEVHYSQSAWIKELCIIGVSEPDGERLHAIVVPDMDEFRRRGQSTIAENIQFDLESLSKQQPSYYRILSFSIRHDPLPRTVTRKLQRYQIQEEEKDRYNATVRRAASAEHVRFKEGAGAVVAKFVRQTKPDVGPLDVSMNLELDLGFDSLARVELLGLAEAELGVRVD